ncbi:MAG: alpha-amylase [Bacteroidales bacterium]|nr:alpha-amylase [Bacteroidales bacterium]
MNDNKKTQALQHPEWSKNANIYEVNIRQYTKEGTFKAFEKHIDRLHDMGVDILWLMPINPIGEKNRKGPLGSYYSIKDYKAINPEFGNLDDLKSIVNKAHSLNMHVIIDWVANHSSWDNIWVEEHADWYDHDSTGNFVSPFDWTDVISLNYDNADMRNAMIDAMAYWVDSAQIDGFRCDVADLVPTDFWDNARKQLDKRKPVFMLAEAEKTDLQKNAFDMTYAWDFHHLMNDVAQGKKTVLAFKELLNKQDSIFSTNDFRMYFTSNHDENSWNGTVYERMEDAYESMTVLTYILPGMPLIYNGQEAGLNKRLKFFDKDEISWDNLKFANFYTQLNNLKKENPALWNGNFGGDYTIIKNDQNEKVFSILRTKGDNKVLLIANFSKDSIDVNLNFKGIQGEYSKYFENQNIILSENQHFFLNPWQSFVLIAL